MADDIPKTTIVVLLVLTVVISIACTWVVLDNTMATRVAYTTGPGEASGQVKINIGETSTPAPITGEAVSNVRINVI